MKKKRKMIVFMGILLLAGLTIMMGCDETHHKEPANPIINYGNGVYYFPTDTEARQRQEFGHALSKFINENPCLFPVAMTGDSAGTYGWNLGIFVVFQQICPPEK